MTPARLERRWVVEQLVANRRDLLVVSGLGSPTWDVAAAGDHPLNFYLWGAMGGAAMVGLGLALSQPRRPVLVITGDGEMLMGLGSLAVVAASRPANLAIAVLDNERYGETGMQESHTARGVDLAGIAAQAGFRSSVHVEDAAAVKEFAALTHQQAGPAFVQVKVEAATPPIVLPPKDGAFLKDRFMAALRQDASTSYANEPDIQG